MRSTLLLTTAACLALGAFAANPPAAHAQEMMMPDDPSMDMPAGPAGDSEPMVKPRKHRNPDAAQSGTETPQRPKRDLKNAGGEPRRDDARKTEQSQSEPPKPEPRNAAETAKPAKQPQAGDAARQADTPKPTDSKAVESAKPADAAKSADTQPQRKLNNAATDAAQTPASTERRDQPRNAADAQRDTNAATRSTTADTTRPTDTGRLDANARDQGDASARGSLSISADAAPRIQQRLRDRGNRSDVSIDVAIGRPVPERVRLAPLPPEIVDMSPELRGYDYVVVEDEVVVVDPRTRDVVEVIQNDGSTASSRGSSRLRSAETTTMTTRRTDETGTVSSSPGGGSSIRLTLSADQRAFVRDEILKLRDAAMLNIMTGEQLPDRVPTQPIPRNVADQVPDLGSLDYFVSNERIVIVDPQSHGIVDVIQ